MLIGFPLRRISVSDKFPLSNAIFFFGPELIVELIQSVVLEQQV